MIPFKAIQFLKMSSTCASPYHAVQVLFVPCAKYNAYPSSDCAPSAGTVVLHFDKAREVVQADPG